MFSSKSHRPAFTVLELMFSVALLAILAAFLWGIGSRVRARSNDVRCLTNLRSTGLAALQYLHDHQGIFFPSKYWFQNESIMTPPGMRDYLVGFQSGQGASKYQYDTVLTCLVSKRLAPAAYPSALNRSYTMNRFLLSKNPSSVYDGDEANRPALPGGPGRLANVPSLASMWAFTDAVPLSQANRSIPTTLHPSEVSLLPIPHGEKQQVVFMDGHAEQLALEEFLAPRSTRMFWGNLNESF